MLVQNTRRHSFSNLRVCLQPPEETGPLTFLRAMLSGEEFAAFEARQAAAATAAEAEVARRLAGGFCFFLFISFWLIGSQCCVLNPKPWSTIIYDSAFCVPQAEAEAARRAAADARRAAVLAQRLREIEEDRRRAAANLAGTCVAHLGFRV